MRWTCGIFVGLGLFFAGCGDKGGSSDSGDDSFSCPEVSVSSSSIEATVDGHAWVDASVTWVWAGSTLQLNSTEADGFNMSFALRETTDGTAIDDAIESGIGPYVVDLGPDGGGFALLYAGSGSYASEEPEGSGTMIIAEVTDTEVAACFTYRAASAAGETLDVESGQLRAVPFQ